MNREELLHNAICRALHTMKQAADMARSEAGRTAMDILRRALMDYAEPGRGAGGPERKRKRRA